MRQESMSDKAYTIIRCASHEEWLRERSKGIGGSDAACILGLNPWKSNQQLWREKMGLLEPEDISDKPAVIYGHKAEGSLRQLFKLDFPEYKLTYRNNTLLRNKALPWIHASLDGALEEVETGRKGILEIKTTSILQSMQKEKWNDRVPDNYYLQCLHYLLVTGWDFVVLKAQLKFVYPEMTKLETRHYKFERADREDDLRMLLTAEIAFKKSMDEKEEPGLILPPMF